MLRLTQPRIRDLDEQRRSATPLELFFDLVFTAALGQISIYFAEEPTFSRLGRSVLLFVPIVWTWIEYTLYGNRFDSDDVLHRVMKVAGMVGVAVMGVGASRAFGDRSALFVGGFVAARLVLLAMYWRTWHGASREVRAVVRGYLLGYGAGGVAWVVSLAVSPSWRPLVWAGIVLAEAAVPIRTWARFTSRSVNVSHLSERFGLFTILVLAEGWLAIVGGVAQAGTVAAVMVAAAGLLVAAIIVWWTYFDYLEAEALERGRAGIVYVYVHLVLFLGLGLAGAGAEVIVERAAHASVGAATRWAFAGGLAAYAASLAVLRLVGSFEWRRAESARLGVVAGLLSLAALGGSVPPPVLGCLAAGLLGVLLIVETRDRQPVKSQAEASH